MTTHHTVKSRVAHAPAVAQRRFTRSLGQWCRFWSLLAGGLVVVGLSACGGGQNGRYLTGSPDQMLGQYLAIQAAETKRVGFTEARQMEILKNFGCSNVRKVQATRVIQDIRGEHCTVLGEAIPEMSVQTVSVGVVFAGIHNKEGCWPEGQDIFNRLKLRESDLARMVFQGNVGGGLREMNEDTQGHLCAFKLNPKFN